MNTIKQNSKNFDSWIQNIKLDTEMRNIKLKNWHDNNMEKMKILLEKCTKRKKVQNM